ncbi:MAG: filamentous hemagglutinin family protein [Burkholderiales bacterium]|nr:filamentous hemagglutinin family protein [Burkholderiales bacterium]
MNASRYRLVFSRLLGMLVPVQEGARSQSKGGRGARSAALTLAGVMLSGLAMAQSPAGMVPHASIGWTNAAIDPTRTTADTLTILQSQSRAILDWQQFNLNRGESVIFDQRGNTSWAALNRIWDANPSMIQGTIKADGAVYLINQNGILFKDGAQINVGSLVASALNITDDVFRAGLLSLTPGDAAFNWGGTRQQFETSMIVIEPGARMQATTGGQIMVFAPRVENHGTISTPEGQTILAAGAKVYLTAPLDASLRGFLVEVDPYRATENGTETNISGTVTNAALGRIVAERGNVTLAALAVNQMGRVTATTSVRLNGSIVLQARDTASLVPAAVGSSLQIPRGARTGTVVVGENSVTAVVAETASTDTTQDSQGFTPSSIDVLGRRIDVQSGALMQAAGGTIDLTAQAGQFFQEPGTAAVGDVRVYVAAGAVIDVSGTEGVVVPVERNFIEVELRGSELADSPLQRNGFLRGQTVTIDIRKGTPLANVSGYIDQVARGVGERTAVGGSITIRSEGDTILRDGSVLDVSAGSIRYSDGVAAETTLLGADGRVYRMSEADPDRVYVGFADRYVVTSSKWGITQTYRPLQSGEYQAGYTEGKNAGTVSIASHGLVLDGSLRGSTTAGVYQRDAANVPLGGQLILGDASQVNAGTPDFKLPDIVFVNTQQKLASDFAEDSTLDAPWADRVQVSASVLRQGGFTRLAAYSNGDITVPADVTLQTAADGSLTLRGSALTIDGDLIAPGGTIALRSTPTFASNNVNDLSQFVVTVGSNAVISTAGLWVNDSPAVRGSVGTDPIVVDGGSVSIESYYDLVLANGSVIDVSGGGHIGRDGRFTAGDGGSIALSTTSVGSLFQQEARVSLGGELRGWALGEGGSVSVTASSVAIGGAVGNSRGELRLASDFFGRGGFQSYRVFGHDGLTVVDGAVVAPVLGSLQLREDAALVATGGSLSQVSRELALPVGLRPAADITLGAGGSVFGNVVIGEGAVVRVDPRGSIGIEAARSVTVLGTVEAPAGTIAIGNTVAGSQDQYEADVAVWLGANSRILARGYADVRPDARGFLRGEILDGGTVTISAGKGYLVTEAGSLIDVSGTTGTVDVPYQGPLGPVDQRVTVASAGGDIQLLGREGMFLDGTLRGLPGAAGVAGGTLTIAMMGAQPNQFFPVGPREIVLSDAGGFLPVGVQPGDPIVPGGGNPDPALNGKAFVNLGTVRSGGFDTLQLEARDAVVLDGNIDLTLDRALIVDAPVLRATGDGESRLSAAYVSIGNSAFDRQGAGGAATGGDATLTVVGKLIDVAGAVVLQGMDVVNLDSTGDVRLRGVLTDTDPSGAVAYGLTGSLTTAADVTIRAAQVYPTTYSDFTIRVVDNPDGAVTFQAAPGSAASPVLSAAGTLTVEAPIIVQQGVVKAPFGEIVFDAGTSLTLAAGSVTSVSGAGQLIPFGRTELSGQDYVYALGLANIVLETLPEKRVLLQSPSVTLEGTVDLSGGGDLYAYEFTAGPGGSRDILDPAISPNSFAIVPSVGSAYAPYDHQLQLGSTGLEVGDQIYLSGVNGLPAGTYTLLPARYALLPGAYLVTPQSGGTDMVASQSTVRTDGSQIVPGYLKATLLDGRVVGDPRSSAFLVESAAVIRQRAEYTDTYASRFFADVTTAQQTADAGRLAIAASQSLLLNGSVLGRTGTGGRGSEVDIVAPKLAVVAPGAVVDNDYVELTVEQLNRLGASSLLLGGLRTRTADGIRIDSVGDAVLIANDADHVLRGPDLMLVAGDAVVLRDGAAIESAGTGGATPGTIVIGGNGAFLRVAEAPLATVARSGFDRAEGVLEVGENAILRSTGSVILDATRDTLIGETAVLDARAVSVAAGRVSLGAVPDGTPGLAITETLLAQLQGVQQLGVKSYSAIEFYGPVNLGAVDADGKPLLQQIRFDAAAIGGYGAGDKTITAGSVGWINSSGAVDTPFLGVPDGSGTFVVQTLAGAGDGGIVLGAGDKQLAGVSTATFRAVSDIVLDGTGSLASAGDLVLDGGRITATTGADQRIASAGGLTTVATADASTTAVSTLGAKVAFAGAQIDHGGRLVLPSGKVTLAAVGDLTLHADSVIDVAGRAVAFADQVTGYTHGGIVALSSTNGDVTALAGSEVDVSGAAGGGDGGSLSVSATGGRFVADGTLKGSHANGQKGAAFALDAGSIPDFGALVRAVAAGGFEGAETYRVRGGNLVVGTDDVVTAHRIALVADAGGVDVAGTLDASGAKAGRIEVWGRDDVVLRDGALLDASAGGASNGGGNVVLGTTDGALDLRVGSTIDVAAGAGGTGGTVLLRTPRTADDIAITALDGTIDGAASVLAEGFRTYAFSTVGAGQFSTITSDNTAWMANGDAMRTRLASLTGLRTGVEIVSDGDLTLSQDWNLFTAKVNGTPGVLTLRAAGNLDLNGSLSDGFQALLPAAGNPSVAAAAPQAGDSWSYRLVGGADLDAANPLAVVAAADLAPDSGNVSLANNKSVRTGNGFIDIAAGGDLVLGNDRSVIYTAGVPGPSVDGFTNPNIGGVPAPTYTDGGGDIRIAAQGSVKGATTDQLVSEWLYRDVKRVGTTTNLRPNPQSTWWVRFDQFRQGVGALGGGDVFVTAGGDIENLSVVIPTNARLGGDLNAAPDLANLVEQGGGDLTVIAGGDILGGVFLVQKGEALISAGGSVGSARQINDVPLYPVIALGDATLDMRAGRDLTVETVFNPTMLRQAVANTGALRTLTSYFSTYTDRSKVSLSALTGDATLSNNHDLLGDLPGTFFVGSGAGETLTAVVYPGDVEVAAYSGDVLVARPMTLFPSPDGHLELLADGSVRVNGTVSMSDLAPQSLPTISAPDVLYSRRIDPLLINASYDGALAHADGGLHIDDRRPIRIVARRGDIVGPQNPETNTVDPFGVFAKAAQLIAGRDVVDVWLTGQNMRPTDVTLVQAGRDIRFNTLRDAAGNQSTNSGRFEIGGQGELQVVAGRNVDLGNSQGLITRGNLNNPYLPEAGAAIRVSTGGTSANYAAFIGAYLEGAVDGRPSYLADLTAYMRTRDNDSTLTAEQALTRFKALTHEQQTAFINHVLFAELKATGRDYTSGRADDYERGYTAIRTLYPETVDGVVRDYTGDLNLFFSQIKTEQGGEIDMRVPGGLVNAGLANPGNLTKEASQLGIVTARGGSVRGFVHDDFLVNQSRVFTLQGGDILLWSSEGDIDAGRGAKTASATPPPQVIFRGNQIILDTSRSVSGSGIGVLLSRDGLVPGDVDLIAPNGEVNAGDAGIRVAGNLNIAALRVVGTENIQVGGVSVGVPAAATSSLGGLAGVSNVANEATKSVTEATEKIADRATSQTARQPSFLTVEVIGLGDEDEERRKR